MALPNFFFEFKGPLAGGKVAQLQACHDGTIGARAMQEVRRLVKDDGVLDDKALTISIAYQGCQGMSFLALYATRPVPWQGKHGYTMSRLRVYGLNESPERYCQGVTALRNIREWADSTRNNLAQSTHKAANPRFLENTMIRTIDNCNQSTGHDDSV